MKNKVSIVVPVYGTERYLKKCLDSLVNQTLLEIEIIVVNDCSPGDCKSIVDEYLQQDNRIQYIKHSQNKGTFGARETGVLASSSEFIIFVDSDDWLELSACQTIYNTLKHHNADIITYPCSYHFKDLNNSPWVAPIPYKPKIEELSPVELLDQIFTYKYTWDNNTKSHASGCYGFKTENIQKSLKFMNIKERLTLGEDFLVTVTSICFSKKCVAIPDKLYNYLIGSGISSVSLTPSKLHYKIFSTRYIMNKTRDILKYTGLWTIKFEHRARLEFVHMMDCLYWYGPGYWKKFLSLVNPNEILELLEAFLDVKRYRRKEHIFCLMQKSEQHRFSLYNTYYYPMGIKNSILTIIKGVGHLFFSLLKKVQKIFVRLICPHL